VNILLSQVYYYMTSC